MERYRPNFILILLILFSLSISLYLFFYLRIFDFNPFDSFFLLAATAGSFLLYAEFFWNSSWQSNCLICLACIIGFIYLNVLFQTSFLFYCSLIFGLWLLGCLHFILRMIVSDKKGVNEVAKRFLVYLSPPCIILISIYFLKLSGQISPRVYDEYLMAIDGTLGLYPSLMMGQFIRSLPLGAEPILNILYLALPLAFIAVYLRRQQLEQKPPYNFFIEFALIGIIGYSMYHIIPGCGSRFAFAATWPDSLPARFLQSGPQLIHCPVKYPRNCLPSLHMAWIICLLRHSLFCDFLTKLLIIILSLLSLIAMFGIGAHYLVDIVVGLAFANCFAALFASQLSWGHPLRWQALVVGILLCLGWYILILYGLAFLQSSTLLAWSIFLISIFLSTGLEFALFMAQTARAKSSSLPSHN